AAALGAPPSRVLFAVKLPILLRPVLIACAVAFAVSVGQYLPTLFAGNGRGATLTTEAVTLAAGADRRVIGAYALVQALFPFAAYLAAVALPILVFRHRRAFRCTRSTSATCASSSPGERSSSGSRWAWRRANASP